MILAAAPTALDYVTLGIAALGAITGVAALAATWAQFMLSGPRLKVTAGTAYAGGPWLLAVTVRNEGRMPVTVEQVSLELQSRDHIPIAFELYHGRAQGPMIPLRLEPYSEATWHLPARELWVGMQKHGHGARVRPFATYAGKRTTARKSIDIAHMASLEE